MLQIHGHTWFPKMKSGPKDGLKNSKWWVFDDLQILIHFKLTGNCTFYHVTRDNNKNALFVEAVWAVIVFLFTSNWLISNVGLL